MYLGSQGRLSHVHRGDIHNVRNLLSLPALGPASSHVPGEYLPSRQAATLFIPVVKRGDRSACTLPRLSLAEGVLTRALGERDGMAQAGAARSWDPE